jgi:hypothetical protein
VAADLDRDGHLDLAVVNVTSSSVSVLLGNGDGTLRPRVDYQVGTYPWAIASGDLDGDGRPDLVVTSPGARTVSVLRGSGDGSFQAPVAYRATRNGAWGVTLADLDGNGALDVVTANLQDSSVSVFRGRGDGTFDPRLDTSVGAATSPRGIVAGDFNGDGKTDLAVAVAEGVGCLLGRGDGTFQPFLLTTLIAGPAYAQAIAAADLDGDGKLDLVVTRAFANTVTVLLGKGDGSFQPPVVYDTPSSPIAVAVADLDGDGRFDVVVVAGTTGAAVGQTVSLYRGNGDGTLQPRVDVTTPTSPTAVAIGDLDGDGRPDLAVPAGGASVSVFLGQCP